ncbi:hypothetical protein QBC32DRAFT_18930 [Pseudoneurospora amorphoporcata]|uniref:Uncharacterized protein n=1 Tax=Pseudoneurospora amorphoporcata TaxID=241081 RepID=A0AAN6SEQ8_9PEZI|nr:hypothetical protein QBC32DRAFT_18930 [Pseudoneurospora amorphoporcata]
MGKVKHADVRRGAQQSRSHDVEVLGGSSPPPNVNAIKAPHSPRIPVCKGVSYLAVFAVEAVIHTASRYGVRSPQFESAEEVVRVGTGSTQSAFKTQDGRNKVGYLDGFRRHVSGRLKDVDFTVSKVPGGMSAMRLRQCSTTYLIVTRNLPPEKTNNLDFLHVPGWPLSCPPPLLLMPCTGKVEHESDLWPAPLYC